MAGRLKSKRQTRKVTTWKQADELLRTAGELQLKINQSEARCNDTINEAKDDLQEQVAPLNKKLAEITERLENFADSKSAEFKKKRSRELQFGRIGWRRSTKIKTKKETLALIEATLPRRLQKQYIKVKKTLNKKELSCLTDEHLAKLGARREEKDVFFAEPLLPKAVDYEQG